MPPESARAVARARPVGKIGRIPFRFLLAEKWGKNSLIIYAPPESARAEARAEPVRWENFAGFHFGFYWLKSGKKMY